MNTAPHRVVAARGDLGILAAALCLVGCSERPDAAPPAAIAEARPAATASAAVPVRTSPPPQGWGCVPAQRGESNGVGRDSVVLWLESPERVRSGEPVLLRLTASNPGRDTAVLHLYVGGPLLYQPDDRRLPHVRPPHERVAYDVRVRGADGSEVWCWLSGLLHMGAWLRIAPGEAVEFPAEWHQHDHQRRPVAPGTYTIQGVLPSPGGDYVSAPQELVITDRRG